MGRCASVGLGPIPAVEVGPILAEAVGPILAAAGAVRACCVVDAASLQRPVEAAWAEAELGAWLQEVEQVAPPAFVVQQEPEQEPNVPDAEGLKPLRPPDCPRILPC